MSRKLLDERIERVDVKSINFHQRRITNAHPSIDDYDYVVRKELEPFKRSVTVSRLFSESIRVPGAITYTVDKTEPGFLDVNDVAVVNNNLAFVDFATFSIDMGDVAFYGTFSLNTANGPADFNNDFANVVVAVVGTSYHNRVFENGDFLFCIVPGSPGAVRIVQIKNIINSTLWTIQFRGSGDAIDESFFGTPRISASRFYFCDVDFFRRPFSTVGSTVPFKRNYKLLLPSKCVAVVIARAVNQSGQGGVSIYNINTELLTTSMPGLYIDNGGFYTMPLESDLTVGQVMPQWISTRQFVGVISAYTKVKTAPTGQSLIVDLLYISPPTTAINGSRKVAIHSIMTINANEFMSYAFDNPPRNRRFPYYGSFPFHELSVVGGYDSIFDSAGEIIPASLPLTPTGEKIFFSQDGDLTPMVAQIGSTAPGSNATVELLT